jgi:hypothetical protein
MRIGADSKEDNMPCDRVTKLLLFTIALFLGLIALLPYVAPPVVKAQTDGDHAFYIEPGVKMLRAPDGSKQVLGKVVVDLRNGKIWGFPTGTDSPYPVDATRTTPPTSHPFFLGTFVLPDMEKDK